MFVAIACLCGSALLGTFVVRALLHRRLCGAEQLLWGVVSGWSVSTTIIYLIARWQGKLSRTMIVWVTLIVCLSALTFVVRYLASNKISLHWPHHYNGFLLVLCLFTPIYWNLFSSHLFARGPNGIYSGGSAFADLSFHAAVSSSFAYGENFPPIYTPHAPDSMLYPLVPDFQTAVLMACGISMRSALMITSLTLALAITGLIFYFAQQLFRNQLVGVVATILFLLNGGLGFIDLIRDWLSGDKSFPEFWNSMQVNYANYSDHGLHWPNIVSDAFVPQRTSLYGIALALMVLTVFAAHWRDSKRQDNRRLLVFAGVLTGLLPLIHVHSFIALGLISVFLFLLRPTRSWVWFWLPAVLIASAPVGRLFLHASGDIVRLQAGWMGHSHAFWPWYLFRNLGLPLLLAIPAWFLVDQVWRRFYVAFLLLLAFTLVVVISPNIFDNGKLIYYWHALNSVIIANFLVRLAFVHRQSLVATTLALLCIITGISALQSESLQSSLLFTDNDISAAEFAKTQTAPHSVFLTAPVINQPILSLAGRRIVRGPTAWLWSHGLEFRDREADVRRMYQGAEDARDLLAYYGVDYVFLGDAEKGRLRANASFFEANFPVVYRGPTIAIYDVRGQIGNREISHPRELAKLSAYDPFALLMDFSRTSFFIYRSWLVANGRMPIRTEFMQAMNSLGRNVLIGGIGWEQQLATNQAELLSELSAGNEISARSNVEYLNLLFTNARVMDDGLRNELLNALNSGSETRASAMRRLIDHPALIKREYNTAYVLVHYFGYLGRNPSDPPDSGLEGLNHWRKILEESGDYRSISRAFLEADEYQKR